MLASVAASAAAARELGYPGLAHLIEADGLGAQQIASLQRLSCCKTAARDYAVISPAQLAGTGQRQTAGAEKTSVSWR